ncbi:MAG: hypothetical protein RBU45_02415 [Myxococcota bacterium]|jgi:hypothetical protein|nr:hypothetical protein [Myxococcota bacterium]
MLTTRLGGIAVLTLALGLSACRGSEPARPVVDFTQEAPSAPGSAAGTAPAAAGQPVAASAARFDGTAALLPRGGEVTGWQLAEPPARYGPDRLFEAINGGADRFLAHGFVELARATYTPAGIPYAEELIVEVYQMKTPLAAFGIYGEDALDCDPPAEAPGPGCSRRSDRIAWQGSVFVKATTYADSAEARKQLGLLVAQTLTRAPGDATLPAELGRLPAALDQPRTRSLHLHAAQEELPGLGPLFRADYGRGEEERSLYLRPTPGPEQAKVLLATAKERLAAGSPPPTIRPLTGVGDEALLVTGEGEVLVLLRQGGDLLALRGASDVARAEALARQALAGLGPAAAPAAPPAP